MQLKDCSLDDVVYVYQQAPGSYITYGKTKCQLKATVVAKRSMHVLLAWKIGEAKPANMIFENIATGIGAYTSVSAALLKYEIGAWMNDGVECVPCIIASVISPPSASSQRIEKPCKVCSNLNDFAGPHAVKICWHCGNNPW